MFENFSAKAIEALQLAREEARRLEFAQVDTDHLLLGLLAEGNGVAARALKLEGLDLRKARVAAEQLGGRGYMRSQQLFFSPDCQAVFFDAAALAAQVEPVLVDTQDLLFALLKHPRCRAIALLRHLNADLEALYRQVRSVRAQDLESPTPLPDPERVVRPKHFSPRLLTESARKAYDQAFAMARAFGHTLVGTEQLLVALVIADEGLAAQVLEANGLNRLDAEAVLHRVMGRGSGTVESKHVLSRRAQEALDAAWREACARGHGAIGTGHVLLGLLGLDAGGALTLMDQLRLNLGAVQLDTEQAFDDSPRDPEPRWAGDAVSTTGDECLLP
ncbi:hypothetical protein J7643_17745 [bacterium]|nr:hypothetical protein [bacterium]